MKAAVIRAGVLLFLVVAAALLLLIAMLGVWQKKELEKGGV